MQYLTGRLAFAIPCKLNSCGIWNISKKDFMDEEKFKLSESEGSFFGDWGIETNKLVPGREYCCYNVANHLRAYLDLLMLGEFDQLIGLYDEGIADARCRLDLFMILNSKVRRTPMWEVVKPFMSQEFGSLWDSFLRGIEQSSEIVEKNYREFQKLMDRKEKAIYGR